MLNKIRLKGIMLNQFESLSSESYLTEFKLTLQVSRRLIILLDSLLRQISFIYYSGIEYLPAILFFVSRQSICIVCLGLYPLFFNKSTLLGLMLSVNQICFSAWLAVILYLIGESSFWMSSCTCTEQLFQAGPSNITFPFSIFSIVVLIYSD